MVVKEVSYEVTGTDDRLAGRHTLQGAGAVTLIIAATPKAAAQTIRKAYDIGWKPVRYLNYPARSIAPATGDCRPGQVHEGLIGGVFGKDPTDERWKDDPGFKEYAAFIAKYMSPAEFCRFLRGQRLRHSCTTLNPGAASGAATTCIAREHRGPGKPTSRTLELPMLLPDIKINTLDRPFPVRSVKCGWLPSTARAGSNSATSLSG